MVEAAGGEVVGVVGAAGGGQAGPLALVLRLNVDKQVLNILIQIAHQIVAAVGEAVHVLGHTAGAVVEAVTAAEQLAQVGDRGGGVVIVGDELARVLVEAHLSALLEAHNMHHGVNQVTLVKLTLDPLSGACHGRVPDLNKLSITEHGDSEDQEEEDDTNGPHVDEKLCWSWTGRTGYWGLTRSNLASNK